MTRSTILSLQGIALGIVLGALAFLGLNVSLFSVDAPRWSTPDSYAEVIDTSAGSVVGIDVTRTAARPTHPLLPPPTGSMPSTSRLAGSGVAIAPDLILTSYHLVRDASAVQIVSPSGQLTPLSLVGTDEASDLAVLRLPSLALPAIRINSNYTPRVGDVVLAIGNPFRVGKSVSQGIISAVNRSNLGLAEVEGFIQTDAAVNPGSSGGALINSRGELAGVITGIVTRDGGFEGVAFAIPTSTALMVADEIVAHGHVMRGYIGLSTHAISTDEAAFFHLPENAGQFIASVDENSPARDAGLKAGDLLIAIDGIAVGDTRETQARIRQRAPGTQIKIDYIRRGQAAQVELTLREKP